MVASPGGRRDRTWKVGAPRALEVGPGALEAGCGDDVLQVHALEVPHGLEKCRQIGRAADVRGLGHVQRLVRMRDVRADEQVVQYERGLGAQVRLLDVAADL